MSGPIGSSQWMYKAGEDYTIDQSLKFDNSKTQILSQTLGTPTNNKIWTLSLWIKRGRFGITTNSASANYNIMSTSGDTICIGDNNGGNDMLFFQVGGANLKTTPKFRDPSGWYHIVYAVDTTQGTAANRVKLYVNGSQITVFGTETYPSQDAATGINSAINHYIGRQGSATVEYYDGYMAEMLLIDGQQLTPASFGETGDYGEWKPIEYAGTFGDNGFHLPFKQDYEVEGFSALTYKGDGSANRYIGGTGFQPDLTWIKQRGAGVQDNVLFDSLRGPNNKLKSNEIDAEFADTDALISFDSDGFTVGADAQTNDSGDTYVAWNWDMGGGAASTQHTITREDGGNAVTHSTAQYKVGSSSMLFDITSADNFLSTAASSDFDISGGSWTFEAWFRFDAFSGSQNQMFSVYLDANDFLTFNMHPTHGLTCTHQATSTQLELLKSSAIGDWAINTWYHIAVVINGPSLKAYVNGTCDTSNFSGTITKRTTSGNYQVEIGHTDSYSGDEMDGYVDEIRISDCARYTANFTPQTTPFSNTAKGTVLLIHSDTTNGSTTFTDSSGTTQRTFAKNTDGTNIDSYVSANTTYGQSIATYTGSGTANDSIGHGLDSMPEFLVVKRRNATEEWAFTSTYLSGTGRTLRLNGTAGEVSDLSNETFGNLDASLTSTVMGLGTHNRSNNADDTYVAYFWHSVAGYSKINSYAGTGGTGNVVTLGFRPAWIIIRRYDASGAGWIIFDTARQAAPDAFDTHQYLYANVNNAEYTAADDARIIITDTTFQPMGNIASINTNGNNYLYMAFADKREYAYWLDQSGNNNDWTSGNLTESDISVDSPTNNFCTFNPLDAAGNDNTYSEGNLQVYLHNQTQDEISTGTMGVSSGKWYWEHYAESSTDDGGNFYVGVRAPQLGKLDYWIIRGSNGEHETTGGTQSTIAAVAWDVGDIIGVALDMDNSKWWVSINGVFVGSPTAGTSPIHSNLSGTVLPTTQNANSGERHTFVANFGQDSSFAGNKTAQGNKDSGDIGDFYYTPPTDFKALCANNLPAVAVKPQSHFSPAIYTANGGTQSITGLDFQPDLVWVKKRSGSASNNVTDSVRGTHKKLKTNTEDAQSDQSGADKGVTSFNSDGFTVKDDASGNYEMNGASGATYVSWSWYAGTGTASGTTSGSGTGKAYNAKYNTDAGFSIVNYKGNTTDGHAIPHHLGVAPDFIVVKAYSRSGVGWMTYNSGLTKNTGSPNWYGNWERNEVWVDASADQGWSDTAPTSSVFTLGDNDNWNDDDEDYIAYCFKNIEGHSQAGMYLGNENADGTFIYTGFRPAFVLLNCTTVNHQWHIYDTAREPENQTIKYTFVNLNNAEETDNNPIDILSNGFKMRSASTGTNDSGEKFMYLAFAETPFKYANAR